MTLCCSTESHVGVKEPAELVEQRNTSIFIAELPVLNVRVMKKSHISTLKTARI